MNQLPNLFVGPLGQAQERAIKFSSGLAKAGIAIGILDKIEELNLILENPKTTNLEKSLTEKLIDEMIDCLVELTGDRYDQEGKRTVPSIPN